MNTLINCLIMIDSNLIAALIFFEKPRNKILKNPECFIRIFHMFSAIKPKYMRHKTSVLLVDVVHICLIKNRDICLISDDFDFHVFYRRAISPVYCDFKNRNHTEKKNRERDCASNKPFHAATPFQFLLAS